VLACYGINPKTVAKVRRRTAVHDAPMGPKEPPSGSYKEEEALIVPSGSIRCCRSMIASMPCKPRFRT